MKNKMLLISTLLQVVLMSGCGAVENESGDKDVTTTPKPQKAQYHIVGEKQAIEAFGKELNKPDEAWDLIHEGSRLYREKQYDQAILILKRTLDMPGGDKWVARTRLQEAYEAKGEYTLALEQVNWKIDQHAKEDVPNGLFTKKQELEKLLESQSKNT